jgi:hypothetical protein
LSQFRARLGQHLEVSDDLDNLVVQLHATKGLASSATSAARGEVPSSY